jgi:hypothetical protein
MRPGIAQFAWILQISLASFRYVVGATVTTGAVFLFTPSFLLPGNSPVLAALCLTGLLAVAWIRRAATIRVVQAVFGR